jgi:predicted transcriptional regulator
MAQTLVEMANDLTRSLMETGRLSAEDVQATLQQTYAALSALKVQEEAGTSAPVPVANSSPVEWRKSIARRTITCLECGRLFKQLSRRHLMTHELDGRLYRAKYGIPLTQPLASRSTTDQRRQTAQQTRPWEKAPTYIKGQARHGTTSPEPEAETLPKETEAPRTAASAQPKRQRQTTPKKKTAQKRSS